MSKQRLSRRQFNTLCAAVGSPLSAISATVALPGAPAFAAAYPARTVKFRDGTIVPALGQGSAGSQVDDVQPPMRRMPCAQAFRLG